MIISVIQGPETTSNPSVENLDLKASHLFDINVAMRDRLSTLR